MKERRQGGKIQARSAALSAALHDAGAISRLEGLEPDALTYALQDAIIVGRVDTQQVVAELLAYVEERQTLDGFIQSRAWKWRWGRVLDINRRVSHTSCKSRRRTPRRWRTEDHRSVA